ncbi:hypothetical protein Xekj_00567 [Xenorhabdus sp. KJ12.1]|nr:hypothetical protein Xekj_00567 [Xenorhabdus sp. KJ12.1]
MLGLIPMFVPVSAVIPIQGVVNLTSNFSRFLFGIKHAILKWLPAYFIGGLVGTALGYPLIGYLPEKLLSIILAIFILLSVWTGILKKIGALINNNYIVSAFQGFISLFVGSVATLSIPLLMERKLNTKQVIVTSAMQMSVLNVFRVAAFFIAGFQFSAYTNILIPLILGSVVGNYIGGYLQKMIPEKIGATALKLIITVLAMLLLYKAVF